MAPKEFNKVKALLKHMPLHKLVEAVEILKNMEDISNSLPNVKFVIRKNPGKPTIPVQPHISPTVQEQTKFSDKLAWHIPGSSAWTKLLVDKIQEAIDKGLESKCNKIGLIKRLRELSGLGLADSKFFIEKHFWN
jgi:ribosomal protein L7/L12